MTHGERVHRHKALTRLHSTYAPHWGMGALSYAIGRQPSKSVQMGEACRHGHLICVCDRQTISGAQSSASHSTRIDWTHEHATVNGRGFASGTMVADFWSFLSALVLAQPSPRAVSGPG